MKKLILLIFTFIVCIHSSLAQVFGTPSATWVFYSYPIGGICFETYRLFRYEADSIYMGRPSKVIKETYKMRTFWPPYDYTTYYRTHFFSVSSDTVFIYNSNISQWEETYNFSLDIGDSCVSPLANPLNLHYNNCPDSLPYRKKALVTNTGTTAIDGVLLRFYTVNYWTGRDTSYETETYYERFISYNFFHPQDNYFCGGLPECGHSILECYQDIDLMTDSNCFMIDSIQHLSSDSQLITSFQISPNPSTDFLTIKNELNQTYHIFNTDGKLILTFNSMVIDIRGFPAGIYIITNENRTIHSKFIKN